MSVSGKMVRQIEIKSRGDVFHELLKSKPHQVSNMSSKVKGCILHEGEWGAVGSVQTWTYTDDGTEKTAKYIVAPIDEENKMITYTCIEGDPLKVYKTFKLTVHVDTKGANNLVTLTIDYEKPNGAVEDPIVFMEYAAHVTKEIETHHLKN